MASGATPVGAALTGRPCRGAPAGVTPEMPVVQQSLLHQLPRLPLYATFLLFLVLLLLLNRLFVSSSHPPPNT